MKKIATLAEVSPTTVSRVFHSPHLVNKETLERIRQITEENNYVYNAVAGNLSSRKTTVIGTLLPNSNRTFFSETLMAIQDRAREYDYSIISGNTAYNPEVERSHLEQFQRHQIAGLILAGCSPENIPLIENIAKSGIPSVIIWEENEDKAFSNVGIDNFKAAFDMTEHMIRLGHRRIGLITGPSKLSNRIRRRIGGYKSAMEKYNLTIDESIIIEREPVLDQGAEAMEELMSNNLPPTAVFAASDSLAIGAMAAARKMDLRIPIDISIAGFDDIDMAAYCCPPLTTIKVPAYEMGIKAVEILIEIVKNKGTKPKHLHLETNLIIRSSTAKPGII